MDVNLFIFDFEYGNRPSLVLILGVYELFSRELSSQRD